MTEEKTALFRKYALRHTPGDAQGIEEARAQLADMSGGYEGALNMEYRLGGRLIGCGIVDAGMNSLSSNYFYYDTDDAVMRRSPGTFSILKEIELCKRADLAFYYLGYYIADCPQMKYKARFRPHELRDAASGEWAAPSAP